MPWGGYAECKHCQGHWDDLWRGVSEQLIDPLPHCKNVASFIRFIEQCTTQKCGSKLGRENLFEPAPGSVEDDVPRRWP